MVVALSKGYFFGGKLRFRRGRESVTIRYSRLFISIIVLVVGERYV